MSGPPGGRKTRISGWRRSAFETWVLWAEQMPRAFCDAGSKVTLLSRDVHPGFHPGHLQSSLRDLILLHGDTQDCVLGLRPGLLAVVPSGLGLWLSHRRLRRVLWKSQDFILGNFLSSLRDLSFCVSLPQD
jgi:hypothetical protein